MKGLTEEERRALRGSKFAPLPSSSSSYSRSKPRLAHPGGPVTTNKAAALAKFLERKLQEPNGLASIKPEILELAVKNAKDTVNGALNHAPVAGFLCCIWVKSVDYRWIPLQANIFQTHGGSSQSGRIVRHVDSFGDLEDLSDDGDKKIETKKLKNKEKKMKKKKDKEKNKKLKSSNGPVDPVVKIRKKKIKL